MCVGNAALSGAEPTTGKILFLSPDRILEGDIIRDGDQFRIRRGDGSTSIPAMPEHVLVATRAEAHRWKLQRIDSTDPLKRIELARWFLKNGMREQALFEAEAAASLKPSDAAIQQFHDDVKKLAATAVAPGSTDSPNPTPKNNDAIAPELSAELHGMFVQKVQPVLMNACATCHTSDRNSRFELVRTTADGNSSATRANLVAFAAHVNRSDVAASRILTNSIIAHGGGSLPPLRDRNGPAYRHLEQFVQRAFRAETSTNTTAKLDDTKSDDPVVGTAADPFDPAIFNRAAHPMKK
jgi:hypothetical protein